MTQKNHPYKILVLSDLKGSTDSTLKSTVSLAKMINGSIHLFHVKKPTQIVERDNQLSAKRSINEKYTATDNKIQNIIAPISKEYGVDINYNFAFGNLKNEMSKYIQELQPDIIVLGKRKPKRIKLLGDKIADFILKEHKGVILIAGSENHIEPNQQVSLGVLNSQNDSLNVAFAKDLFANSQTPLKVFKFVKNVTSPNKTEVNLDTNTVEYVFERNDNTLNNLPNYLSKNNINLLCIDRGAKQSKIKGNLNKSELNDIISNNTISLLLSSN
jgi:nucleotide-binding universal stress UspA family protein